MPPTTREVLFLLLIAAVWLGVILYKNVDLNTIPAEEQVVATVPKNIDPDRIRTKWPYHRKEFTQFTPDGSTVAYLVSKVTPADYQNQVRVVRNESVMARFEKTRETEAFYLTRNGDLCYSFEEEQYEEPGRFLITYGVNGTARKNKKRTTYDVLSQSDMRGVSPRKAKGQFLFGPEEKVIVHPGRHRLLRYEKQRWTPVSPELPEEHQVTNVMTNRDGTLSGLIKSSAQETLFRNTDTVHKSPEINQVKYLPNQMLYWTQEMADEDGKENRYQVFHGGKEHSVVRGNRPRIQMGPNGEPVYAAVKNGKLLIVSGKQRFSNITEARSVSRLERSESGETLLGVLRKTDEQEDRSSNIQLFTFHVRSGEIDLTTTVRGYGGIWNHLGGLPLSNFLRMSPDGRYVATVLASKTTKNDHSRVMVWDRRNESWWRGRQFVEINEFALLNDGATVVYGKAPVSEDKGNKSKQFTKMITVNGERTGALKTYHVKTFQSVDDPAGAFDRETEKGLLIPDPGRDRQFVRLVDVNQKGMKEEEMLGELSGEGITYHGPYEKVQAPRFAGDETWGYVYRKQSVSYFRKKETDLRLGEGRYTAKFANRNTIVGRGRDPSFFDVPTRFVHVNGQRTRTFNWVGTPRVRSGGARIEFGAREGRTFYWVQVDTSSIGQ